MTFRGMSHQDVSTYLHVRYRLIRRVAETEPNLELAPGNTAKNLLPFYLVLVGRYEHSILPQDLVHLRYFYVQLIKAVPNFPCTLRVFQYLDRFVANEVSAVAGNLHFKFMRIPKRMLLYLLDRILVRLSYF